jgi:hypothetical protein
VAEPTVEELAAMPEDQRVQWFLDHPLDDQDPAVDPTFVARARARAVLVAARRDAEQAGRARAS